MLAGGLIATALVNIAFGAGNSLPWFLTFWAINGILQVRPSCDVFTRS
jgi:sugar phosphate permease